MFDLTTLLKNAKTASLNISSLTEKQVNKALLDCANAIRTSAQFLIEQNKLDLANAREKNMTDAFIDRRTLNNSVIESIACGIEQVAKLKSPRNKVCYRYKNRRQKIDVKKIYVPFGVIGIIFESRPNVTADAFALCFKTANAVVLRGGSDAINSNKAIVEILRNTLSKNGIDKNAVSLIEDTSREVATEFMKRSDYVDLLIPRGGASLIDSVKENSSIPIIETGKGNCHIYVDKYADIDKAVKIIYNAKTQRYSVCNACESLVIHTDILGEVLPLIAESLREKQVEIACDERAEKEIKDYPYLVRATEEDFYAEYGKAKISVKTVDNISLAIEHINKCSTKHSEAIITECPNARDTFFNLIDSSCVYHNASTRFSDGFVFGLGAEIGISTQKLHARGPMGLNGLVTTKYIINGNGAVRK